MISAQAFLYQLALKVVEEAPVGSPVKNVLVRSFGDVDDAAHYPMMIIQAYTSTPISTMGVSQYALQMRARIIMWAWDVDTAEEAIMDFVEQMDALWRANKAITDEGRLVRWESSIAPVMIRDTQTTADLACMQAQVIFTARS